MPELPEVETIKNTVAPFLQNVEILDVIVRQKKFREPVPDDFAERIRKTVVISLKRIAKYLLINLNNGLTIIWHFGMSGKFRIAKTTPDTYDKHDHIILRTAAGELIYNDVRRFGLITYCRTAELKTHPLLRRLGLDPWDDKLTTKYLRQKLQHCRTPVKTALLNQEIICGIGNIYASEILYKARISPQRESDAITVDECEKIIHCTREILECAIKAGGSTIHDYRRPDGDTGHFQERHCVYNKTGQRCPDCICDIKKTGGIRKVVQNGRSTFFCPTLQK